MDKTAVLFVCLGNICRSPLAEGVFRKLVEEASLADQIAVDSCGTGAWHVGEPPHPDSISVAKENGVSLRGIRARQLNKDDFEGFDYLVAMDRENLRKIKGMRTQARGKAPKIFCLRDYEEHSKDIDVPDPYYTGDFQGVYEIIERCCIRLFEEIKLELD